MKWLIAATAAMALAAAASSATASVIVLDFEGVGNENPVGNFYNGGGGPNYGVSFSPATLALVDADAGGDGNFANEPSPNTIMFFTDANNAILNYAAGFTTGFSFFYTSSTAASVDVFDGLDGTGALLGTLSLSANAFSGCPGDPTGDFSCWNSVGVAFGGVAKSINFGGTAGHTGFDDVTFGSATAGGGGGGGVPEPAGWALMISGMALAGAAVRRRRGLALAV